jgi:hypothetical protein
MIVQLSLLPLRLFVDHDALLLLKQYLALNYSSAPSLPSIATTTTTTSSSPPITTSTTTTTTPVPGEPTQRETQPDSMRFAKFEITPLKLNVDFKPKYLSVAKMLADRKEAINIATLQNAPFSLDAIRLTEVWMQQSQRRTE